MKSVTLVKYCAASAVLQLSASHHLEFAKNLVLPVPACSIGSPVFNLELVNEISDFSDEGTFGPAEQRRTTKQKVVSSSPTTANVL